MRFVVDECAGPTLAQWLRTQSHEVFSVFEEARGMGDDQVLQKAFDENWILITCDRHFGGKIYRDRRQHRGVILLRLEDQRSARKVDTVRRLLERYADQLPDQFVVVTEKLVRFGSVPS